jgi:hypothetical protein
MAQPPLACRRRSAAFHLPMDAQGAHAARTPLAAVSERADRACARHSARKCAAGASFSP